MNGIFAIVASIAYSISIFSTGTDWLDDDSRADYSIGMNR